MNFQQLETLQLNAFLEWSKVIKDPVIPCSGANGTTWPSSITGVSVSFAGDWLPSGRKTFTNPSKAVLDAYLKAGSFDTGKVTDWAQHWDAYGELFLALHWKLYGRNASLMSHLLHRKSDDEFALHVDLSVSDDKLATPASGIAEMRAGKLGSSLLLKQDENRRFVQELFGATLGQNPTKEEIYEVASELVLRFKRADGCLDRQYHDGSLELRAILLSIAKTGNLEAHFDSSAKTLLGLDKTTPADLRTAIEQTAHLLQLLYLYQPLGKDHVYLFCPEGSLDEARACFVAWSSSPLDDTQKFFNLAKQVAKGLHKSLKDGSPTGKQPIDKQSNILIKLIGPELETTVRNKMKDNQGKESHAWLGHYLAFCDRLADVAVHEGKKLGFSFFVSSGEAASREIEFVSRISANMSAHLWEVNENLQPQNGCEEIISRLLGNYSFLQGKGCIIHCSWDGHLLALARLLVEKKTPETLTKTLNDAYLIRIEKNRDIKVFYGGDLVLWRRGARWLVPTKYGDAYQTQLAKEVKARLPDAKDAIVKEICINAWELSHYERGGACFLVADLSGFRQNNTECQFRSSVVDMTEVFPYAEGRQLLTGASRSTFQELAVQDGATLVDEKTGEVFGRRQIAVPMLPTEWEHHVCELKKSWPDSHKILRWGTRHLNALRAALHFKGAAVLITVSSDGDIHLFDDKGPVQDATYPGV